MTVKTGHMVLHDRMQPALLADNYRIKAKTDVQVDVDPGSGETLADVPLTGETRYFDVVGPRFKLPPTELAGVFPPRNGHGDFTDTMPHAAFGRRTLLWERDLDPSDVLDPPAREDGDPPALTGIRPWIALLLFEEDEITIARGQALEDVLPASVRTAIEAPSGISCDALVVGRSTLLDVLPTPDELELLSHVREVNVHDRELAAGDSDGWFSVCMSNRLPKADRKYRACIVSVEGRTDLFAKLKVHLAKKFVVPVKLANATRDRLADLDRLVHDMPERDDLLAERDRVRDALSNARTGEGVRASTPPPATAAAFVVEAAKSWTTLTMQEPQEKLVLLASWGFESVGTGTFRLLAQSLDVAMIGEHAPGVGVADSGHVAIQLRNRAGTEQTAWYRGPLVPYPLTRDTEGPYHSADQCRRVSPGTGMEDITYSAAFEVGRLLATSDGRLAQELMRWRRTAYRAARRVLTRAHLAVRLDLPELPAAIAPLTPMLQAHLAKQVVGLLPRVDRYGTELVANAPGLDPTELTKAWRLADSATAQALLGGMSADQIGGVASAPALDQAGRGSRLRQLRATVMDTLGRKGGA